MTTINVRGELQRLFQIAEAGEKGFATAAINMPDPALKILFKLYAQQRLDFKNEILDELRRLHAPSQHGYSIPGAIHRGRVAIFSGMSTDHKSQAVVILKEVVIGERTALNTYSKVLAKDLPEPTRGLVERQLAILQKVFHQVQRLRENERFRSAVRVFGNEQDARQGIQALVDAGFAREEIERMDLNEKVLYQGKGATRLETILSGAVGGAIWGGVTGLAAGFGVVEFYQPGGHLGSDRRLGAGGTGFRVDWRSDFIGAGCLHQSEHYRGRCLPVSRHSCQRAGVDPADDIQRTGSIIQNFRHPNSSSLPAVTSPDAVQARLSLTSTQDKPEWGVEVVPRDAVAIWL